MPRRNLSVVSKEEDPYRLQRYPVAFQVMLSNGKQAHNARELVKAAKFKGQWLDMARQPIPAAKVREILALTGQRRHANTGRFMPASQLAKLRKLAKRELLARQGKRVVGPMSYNPRARQLERAYSVGETHARYQRDIDDLEAGRYGFLASLAMARRNAAGYSSNSSGRYSSNDEEAHRRFLYDRHRQSEIHSRVRAAARRRAAAAGEPEIEEVD